VFIAPAPVAIVVSSSSTSYLPKIVQLRCHQIAPDASAGRHKTPNWGPNKHFRSATISIINLGSLCVDHVYRVTSLAGAGETVAAKSYDIFPGGKGLNQSLAAAKAGAEVVHAGAIGKDGTWLLDLLQTAGANTDQVQVLDDASGHALIQVNDAGENSIVINGGTNRGLTRDYIDTVLATVGPEDWLLLQNEINELNYVLTQAAEKNLQVAFNIAPPDERISSYPLSAVRLFVLNLHEASALTGQTDKQDVMHALQHSHPNAASVLTLGSSGLHYMPAGGTGFEFLGAHSVSPVDETAAGDAFTGYLLAGLATGAAFTDALKLASAAGALAVTAEGAASSIPERAAVEEFLARQ